MIFGVTYPRAERRGYRGVARVPDRAYIQGNSQPGLRHKGGIVKSLRRAASVSALACGLTLVTSSAAVAAVTPVLITGPSPYSACSQFDNSLTGSTFPNGEVEPQAAVHGSTAIA